MILVHPYCLLLLVVALPVLLALRPRSHVRVTALETASAQPGALRRAARSLWASPATTLFRALPRLVLCGAVACVTVALCKPQVIRRLEHTTTVQGREIILALDYSGSMAEPFKGSMPKTTLHNPFQSEVQGNDATAEQPRRIDAAQAFILNFVERRIKASSADSIALIAFDDRPRLCWPLDRDLNQIVRHGNFVPRGNGPGGLGSGTNFGTTPPGPIDMAAEHFGKRGKSQSRVLILVSDGDNDLDPKVQKRLAEVIRNAGMRFYVIGVGEVIAKKDVDILKVARAVNGVSFRVENADEMERCFAEIDRLESSPIPQASALMHEELFHIPLSIALALFLVWLMLEGTLTGR